MYLLDCVMTGGFIWTYERITRIPNRVGRHREQHMKKLDSLIRLGGLLVTQAQVQTLAVMMDMHRCWALLRGGSSRPVFPDCISDRML